MREEGKLLVFHREEGKLLVLRFELRSQRHFEVFLLRDERDFSSR